MVWQLTGETCTLPCDIGITRRTGRGASGHAISGVTRAAVNAPKTRLEERTTDVKKIELHLLQNFAPSNLNRDDTGAPKDCEFGGHRRARISSQCQKRAVRQAFETQDLIDDENRGARTKRLIQRVADVLHDTHGLERESGLQLAIAAIESVGLGRNKKGIGDELCKTDVLLFVPSRIVTEIARVLHDHRTTLLAWVERKQDGEKTDEKNQQQGAKQRKSAKRTADGAYPEDVKEAVEDLLSSARRTVDIALFGRMIAKRPEWNVDAACQVAQAISTNRVQMDFDFFTAIDDLKPKDTAGSDMMGTVQFNSSCFYRYAVLDVNSLRSNLNGDDPLVRRAVSAFIQAFVTAIPTGKQNSMAAHNFPSYALAIVRENGQPLSLANAFLKPARPRGEDVDLVDDSIQKLESYAVRLRDALGQADSPGAPGPTASWISWADRDLEDGGTRPARAKTVGEFYSRVTGLALPDLALGVAL
jgi:CRISPR system Cascade subunit CasC